MSGACGGIRRMRFQGHRIDPIREKVDINAGQELYLDIEDDTTPGWSPKAISKPPDFSALRDGRGQHCVPTPLRKPAILTSPLLFRCQLTLQYVHPGMVIVLESTTYPGTTRV